MYRFNYFTEKANHVINLAITSAEELGHNYIGRALAAGYLERRRRLRRPGTA